MVRMFQGTCYDQLRRQAKKGSTRSTYTDVFNLFSSLGLLAVPAYSYVARRGGHFATSMATGVFVLAALGLGLVENLELQIIAFIAWAAGRQFLFSAFFAFMHAGNSARSRRAAVWAAGLVLQTQL